jgi:hypothetical protein
VPNVVKSSLAAGVALVGAAVVVVTPVESAAVNVRTAGIPYTLTAASAGLSNVPVNLFNMVMSIPAWEIEAMGRLADAMVATGSWQVWGPTNVFGFDEQDPPKVAAIIDMLIPIKPISSVVGEQVNWWAVANLPMNAGCAAAPSACPDPGAMLRSMFTVPPSKLYQGYQFPVVTNPFNGQETSWSGRYVKLDRGAVMTSLGDYLTAAPSGVETVSLSDVVSTISRLGTSFRDGFNPFVQNSEWFDNQSTVAAPLFRALAPVICPSCDPANPYDNPWLKNYPAQPATSANSPVSVPASPPAAAATANDPVQNVPDTTADTPAVTVNPHDGARESVPARVTRAGERSSSTGASKASRRPAAHPAARARSTEGGSP